MVSSPQFAHSPPGPSRSPAAPHPHIPPWLWGGLGLGGAQAQAVMIVSQLYEDVGAFGRRRRGTVPNPAPARYLLKIGIGR